VTDWVRSASGLLRPSTERHIVDPTADRIREVARLLDAHMMADWSQSNQDQAPIVISPFSKESIGTLTAEALFPSSQAGSQAPWSNIAWPANNWAVYIPFIVSSPMIVQNMAIWWVTASGNVDVGVYDDQQHRMVSKGSTAASGTNAIQKFSLTSTTLKPGVYYMAMCCSTTAAQPISAPYDSGAGNVAACRGLGLLGQAVGAVTLPDPATFAVAAYATLPFLAVYGRSVI